MPTEKELAMQRKQDELQQQQQAEANAVLATQPTSLARELTPKEQSMVRMTQALNPETKEEAPALEQTKPTYLADYTTDTDLWGIAKRQNKPLQDVFNDYQKWGRETGNNTDFLPMWTAAQKGDVSKSPQEIEKEQKKLKARERMESFGNFLTHLGNFIGTTAFGAPSQTLEPAKELTARQQAMRDRTEALRTAYNKSFFENYWKQRSQERANANQDRLERKYNLAVRQQEWKELSDQKKFDYNIEKLKIEEDYKDGLISIKEKELAIKRLDAYTRSRNASTAASREGRLANGTKTTVTKNENTPLGPKSSTTTTVKEFIGRSGSSSSKDERPVIDY